MLPRISKFCIENALVSFLDQEVNEKSFGVCWDVDHAREKLLVVVFMWMVNWIARDRDGTVDRKSVV